MNECIYTAEQSMHIPGDVWVFFITIHEAWDWMKLYIYAVILAVTRLDNIFMAVYICCRINN
jgi:hypothetical protein